MLCAQIPTVGVAMISNNWGHPPGEGGVNNARGPLGDYSGVIQEPGTGNYRGGAKGMDVGAPHIYHGGHEPVLEEWLGRPWPPGGVANYASCNSYNGRLVATPDGTVPAYTYLHKTIPLFITETGWMAILGPGNPGGEEWYCRGGAASEFYIRNVVQNYAWGVKRTYVYKLTHDGWGGGGPGPPFGLFDHNFTTDPVFGDIWQPQAQAYGLRNLLALVGFEQGPDNTPLNVPHQFTPGPNNAYGYAKAHLPHRSGKDALVKLVLRKKVDEWVVILCRQRTFWEYSLGAGGEYVPVADPKSVPLGPLPPGTWQAKIAEPAKNPRDRPLDGQTYANPDDGQAYTPITVTPARMLVDYMGVGAAQGGITMAGLTRVIHLKKVS